MNEAWEPCAEPWGATVRRTGSIAAAIGSAVGLYQRHVAPGVLTAIVALWFTLGGHFAELFFLNWLRFRLGGDAKAQAGARLVYWFVAGSVLCMGAFLTLAMLTGRPAIGWRWWIGGLFFVGLELVVHLFLRARGRPNFYDGRG
jgi:hypothetical protein